MSERQLIVVRSGASVDASAVASREARKALAAIDVRFTNKPISLLQHKIYNVWIAFAQSHRNALETRVFEFPLNEVMELAGFNSRDLNHFVSAAETIMDLRVRYDSINAGPDDAEARRVGGSARRRRSGYLEATQLVSHIKIDWHERVMRVEFPEQIRGYILRPEYYTTVDLRKQALFSSRASLALYEYVRSYASAGTMPWLPWEEYSMLLAGTTAPHACFRDFSKQLRRALQQVNSVHSSHFSYAEFTKRGKAYDKMRVCIELAHQAALQLEAVPENPALLSRICRWGFSESDARVLMKQHPAEYLEAQLAHVQRRLSDKTQPAVRVPAAYLRTAIAGNYANAAPVPGWIVPNSLEPGPAQSQQAATRSGGEPHPAATPHSSQVSRVPMEESDPILVWFRAQREDDRKQLAAEFLRDTLPVVRLSIERNGFRSPLAAASLSKWLRERNKVPPGEVPAPSEQKAQAIR